MKKFLFSVMIMVLACFSLTGCSKAGLCSVDDNEIGEVIHHYYTKDMNEAYEFVSNLDTNKYMLISIDDYFSGWDQSKPCHVVVKYKDRDTNADEEGGTIGEGTSTEEHSHVWDVKEVGDELVVFCKECGKMAE